MKDVYLMNRETGELVPSEKVIRDFYQSHGWRESVFDFWTETGLEVEGSQVDPPSFSGTLNI